MTLKFFTTDEVSLSQGCKILGYSGSGVGKTKLCSTAPRPFILSAEAGLLSLRKFKLPGLLIESMNDLDEAYLWATAPKNMVHYDTLCLDSLTEMAERMLNAMLPDVKDPRQAYSFLYPKMETLIRAFRDIKGKHVYMSAKMEQSRDEISGATKWGPSMPGQKFGPKIPYFFDQVVAVRLHATKDPDGNHYRYLQTQPDLQYDAKDRSGNLLPMEPPDLTHLFNKMIG